MIKLLKHLKQFWALLLVILGFLIVQAWADLTLPQYTSDIVNVGIQAGGIENGVPDVIRQSQMEHLMLLMSDEDKQFVEDHYTLLDRDTMDADELQEATEKYPVLTNESVYELNEVDEDTNDELADIFAQPMMIAAAIDTGSEQVAEMETQLKANLPAEMPTEDMTVFDILAMLPEEQLEPMREEMDEQFSAMPDSILEQASVAFVKSEYEAVGLDTDSIQNRYILLTGAKMLLIALVSMACSISVGYMASRVAAALGRNLRENVFEKVVSFSNAEFDHFSTASLITRSTNDIQQIQMFVVMLLRMVLYAPIVGIGGVIKVFNTNSSMSWIIGVAVAAIVVLVLVLFATVMPRFKLVQKLIDRLNLVTREILTGIMVIRAFGTEKHEEKRFDKANDDLTRTNLFVNRVMTCMMPTMMLIMNGITLLIMWNGAYSIDDGVMQVGDLMAFIQYTMQIIMAFLMISMVSVMLPRASVSMTRIDEVLVSESVIMDPENPQKSVASEKGVVEFRDVSFRYPNAEENVLSHISFTAKPGQTTAFIGSTGSGKSTLVNLIPRFYDVTEGQVLVDGVDVRDMSQHELHDKLGYVPQKGVLFSGTIDSNLRYGKKDASEETIRQAAEIAQATEFIDAKPDGYDSPIAQGGTNVSGGQKQRLSIARAIAKDPKIYIFDDSFSALDYKTDLTLRNALKEHTGDATVLIVAQRISTILHADQILVLDDGHVVGKGTHSELMKSCEEYQQIAMSQLSKEELEHE
jgi:ATP-binding cassette subfamily B multidrug efflux pump